MKKYLILLLFFLTIQIQAQTWWMIENEEPRIVYALNLNGTNEWARKLNPTGINIEPDTLLTIMVWVKSPDVTNSGLDIGARVNTYDFWQITRSSSKPAFIFYDNSPLRSSTLGANSVTTNNTWYFLAVTIGIDSMRIYVNGTKQSVNTTPPASSFNDAPTLDIGAWTELNLQYSSVTIGEIQIIAGRALTAAEILQNYVRGLNGLNYLSSYSTGRIVAWYKWEGTSDAEFLNDASSFNNDLTGNNVTQADDQVILIGGYK